MAADNIVQWITRITVVIGAIGAILALLQTRRTGARAEHIGDRVEEVHVLVNGRLTAVTARVEQLVQILHEHGIDVPPDPASPVVVLPPLGPDPVPPGSPGPGTP